MWFETPPQQLWYSLAETGPRKKSQLKSGQRGVLVWRGFRLGQPTRLAILRDSNDRDGVIVQTIRIKQPLGVFTIELSLTFVVACPHFD
jgi:hypothetical protein